VDRRADFQYRSADLAGDTITAHRAVTEVEVADGVRLVTCEIGILNQRGEETTTGRATVASPQNSHASVALPFRPERRLPSADGNTPTTPKSPDFAHCRKKSRPEIRTGLST
jgi:hypothetical protein